MHTHHFRHYLLSLLGCCFVVLFAACGPHAASSLNTNQLATSASQASTGANSRVTVAMPPTQTSCPPQGQGRAAVTAPLTLGTHQNIVYVYNTSTAGILRRYDVSTGQKTTIVSLSNVAISDAQVSTDGQYVLFLSKVSGQPAIQMIRMDGQGLQTLYCGSSKVGPPSITNLVWSPNQQLAVFEEPNPGGAPGAPIVQLLNLSSGTVQTEITPTNRSGYVLRAWLNNTEVYMTGYYTNQAAPPHDVFILDLSKGPNQNNNTKQVASIQGYDWDINLTTDGSKLILSQCSDDPQLDMPAAPSLISSQPATGGILNVIYASHVHAVTQARIISSTTLLFILGGKFGIDPAPGLWKINLDGSGLTHLTADGRFLSNVHTPWSTVSRDGKLYAVGGYNYNGAQSPAVKLLYGSLSGGAATQFAITNAGEDAQIAGWTTM
jgi:eukaryotic-like serine/threonine-protein kinase